MVQRAEQIFSEKFWHLSSEQQIFSQSLLWDLQQRYFAEKGVEAWRQGEVPHYVTSNPTIANAYAEIVLAFRRDRDRLAPGGPQQPLTISELGAGSGRFAFYFLKRLQALCAEAGVAPDSFRYVLTDVAEANLDFWRRHPCFQPFFSSGVLDVARFDVMQPGALALQAGGRTIAPGSLGAPLVVIANYLFDSVPADLFRFQDGQAHQCLVSLSLDADPATLDAAETLARMKIDYGYAGFGEAPYAEPWLGQLLDFYRREMRDTHLLLPAAGLRCLDRLAALSRQGLLVLSADKGEHRLAALEGNPPPNPVRHGSISLPVNYHAFTQLCTQRGGLALVPESRHDSINVLGLLMLPDADGHSETRHAYRRHVQDFGPDSFFSITRHARQTIPQMSAEDILAYLRLSRHDSHQFGRYLPRLHELAAEFDDATREDVVAAIEKVWDTYFPLGEDLDLANRIAGLLYAMDEFARALVFYERSIGIYGRDTGTLYNMAACRHMLGEDDGAAALLRTVLAHEPGNQAAAALAARLSGKEKLAVPSAGAVP
jgi:Tetratricopeptide repeat